MALNKSFFPCEKCKEKSKRLPRKQLLAQLCDECLKMQKETSIHCLEATILVNGNTIEKCEIVSSSSTRGLPIDKLLDVDVDDDIAANSCSCQACVERKFLSREQLRDVQDLQKCWVQLRHSVRQIYRDRLLPGCVTGKGKKIDGCKIRELVDKLCASDAHQLFQRLECQAKEYVMDLKVQLLQILVSPHELGLNGQNCSNLGENKEESVYTKTLTSEITPLVAQHFLNSMLELAHAFFDTLDNMQELFVKLQDDHLSKFEITWRVVNYALFYSVILQDPLVRVTLPAVYRAIGFPTVFPIVYSLEEDSFNNVNDLCNLASSALPEHRELICDLWELDSIVFVNHKQMNEARQRMDEFLARQMKIYQGKLKAKQKMLKQDLEFFKQKRRLLEEYVSKKKDSKKTSASAAATNDEDLAAFAEALRGLLCSRRRGGNDRRRRVADVNATTTLASPSPHCVRDDDDDDFDFDDDDDAGSMAECPRCRESHCPCDQCTVSHLITCGLTESRDEPRDDDASGAEDNGRNPTFKLLSNCENACSDTSSSSLDSSDSDGSDEDSVGFPEAAELETLKDNYSNMDLLCRKHTSITCLGGKKVTKVQTTILPSYYRTKSSDSTDSLNRQIYHAYGDWEVSTDPASLLLNLPLGGSSGAAGRRHRRRATPSPPSLLRRDAQRASCKMRGVKKCLVGLGLKTSSAAAVPSGGPAGRRRRRASASAVIGALNVGGPAAAAAAPDLIRDILAHCPKNGAGGAASVAARSSATSNVGNAVRRTPAATDSIDDRVPPEFLKIMKDEKLAKALAVAVAKRNGLGVKAAASLKTETPYWRDLNLDAETVRRVNDAGSHSARNPNPAQKDAPNPDAINEATVEKRNFDQKSQHDVDTSSERSSSTPPSINSKDGRHCDCCYCEMFGQNNNRFGRDDFPQIRERLRLKLKSKCPDGLPTECQNNKNANDVTRLHDAPAGDNNMIKQDDLQAAVGNNQLPSAGGGGGGGVTAELYRSEDIQGYRGFESIDKLMEYIEGGNSNNGASNAKSVKQQQPIKKQGKKQPKKKNANKSSKVIVGQSRTVAKQEIMNRHNSAEDLWSIDEVFKPKDIDLEASDLDEAEKEVEIFKRFVFDCRPVEKREKIHLDLSNLSFQNSAASNNDNNGNGSARLATCQS